MRWKQNSKKRNSNTFYYGVTISHFYDCRRFVNLLIFFSFSLFQSIHMHGHVIYISKMLADKLIQAIILIQIIIYSRCFDNFFFFKNIYMSISLTSFVVGLCVFVVLVLSLPISQKDQANVLTHYCLCSTVNAFSFFFSS